MKEIERRILIDSDIFYNEYSYFYGDKKNDIVSFWYYNIKTTKLTEKRFLNYRDSLNLARKRETDKRYKNFEFWITL